MITSYRFLLALMPEKQGVFTSVPKGLSLWRTGVKKKKMEEKEEKIKVSFSLTLPEGRVREIYLILEELLELLSKSASSPQPGEKIVAELKALEFRLFGKGE